MSHLITQAGDENDPVFVGVGEIPSGRYPQRTFIQSLTQVAVRTLKSAQMRPADVDTIVLIPNLHSFDDQADLVFSRMVEELGMNGEAKSNFMVHSGGSTSDNTLRVVHGLIAAGHAKNVLVLQAEGWGSADLSSMITMLSANGIPRQWERPIGQNFNAIGALITSRYMHESGASHEDLAHINVSLRKWANLNENAMFYDRELTVDKVLGARVIADPLRMYDAPPLADGGVGFVMSTQEEATKRGLPSVRVAASDGVVSHFSLAQDINAGRLGWRKAAERTYANASWGPDDADLAQIYDSYPAVMAIAMEGLGFASSGEGPSMVASGATSPGGSGVPMNTNGGLLSAGHTGVGGGTALMVEGVRQLLGWAPSDRQVENARRAIIGGSGGSYMDSQVVLLERA